MGTCGTSKSLDDPNEIKRLKEEYLHLQNKNKEQQNLLRFKIEVLINMLAVEEKKSEHSLERLEILKWELFQKGIDEEKLTKILQKSLNSENEENRDKSDSDIQVMDAKINRIGLSTAIERTQKEFDLYRSELIPAFADDDGKFEPSMNQRDFMKRLYQTTESLTKVDIELIALRFSDQYGSVNVPEFIDYFISSSCVRSARSASAAVRMSLDMLHIQHDSNDNDLYVNDISINEKTNYKEIATTHLTQYLDAGVTKLLVMWPIINDDMMQYYEDNIEPIIEDENEKNESLIEFQVFKDLLKRFCGSKSISDVLIKEKYKRDNELLKLTSVKSNQNNINIEKIEYLTNEDIDLLSERFELTRLVHFKHFFQFFNELHNNKLILQRKYAQTGKKSNPNNIINQSVSPFRISSEWKELKEGSMVKKYSMRELKYLHPPPPKPDKKLKPILTSIMADNNNDDVNFSNEDKEKSKEEKLRDKIDFEAKLLLNENKQIEDKLKKDLNNNTDNISNKDNINKDNNKENIAIVDKSNSWLCCGIPNLRRKKEILSTPPEILPPSIKQANDDYDLNNNSKDSNDEELVHLPRVASISKENNSFRDSSSTKSNNNDNIKIKTDAILRKLSDSFIDYLGPYSKNANKIKEVFSEIDHENCGLVDRFEFKQSLKILKIQLPNEDIELIFKRFDFDQKGIDYHDFVDSFNLYNNHNDNNNSNHQMISSKSQRMNMNNNDHDDVKSPKSSLSPMKKSSVFKPKTSFLKEENIISTNNNTYYNNDEDDIDNIDENVRDVSTRWKK